MSLSGQRFEKKIKLIILGESGCGKTSICKQLVTRRFSQAGEPSTIGVAYFAMHVALDEGLVAEVALWDTAGAERFRSVMPSYYRDADAAFIVFDVTSRPTFEKVTYWLDTIPSMPPAVKSCAILLGNKADRSDERVVTVEEAEALATRYGMPYADSSALTGQSLDAALRTLVNAYVQYFRTHRPQSRALSSSPLQVTPPPSSTSSSSSSSCC
jgi:small GTP-binding protein